MDVNFLIELLELYQEGELSNSELMTLKDQVLDLSQKLHDDGVEMGWKYEEMMLLIRENDDFPYPYTKMVMESPLTGEKYNLDIKEIVGLRRNKKGELIVETLTKKTKIK